MAHSRKSKSSNFLACIEEVLHTHVKQDNHLIVALSGGIDSVVLLDTLIKLSKPWKFNLSAVHVDHGISENSTHWREFCSQLCSTQNIPISITRLIVKKEQGMSLEALARDARYQVFNDLKADYVVLAQHLDDQAETLLLQLLRGAGVKGLAAMPVIRKQTLDSAPQILRPLLQVSRYEIEDYAHQNQLKWIVDESNDNTFFNRNFLRHEIFPLLKERYPSYQATFSRASHHLAEASHLLDDLAILDEKTCVRDNKLQIDGLSQLSHSRAKNLLRFTFSQHGVTLPSAAKLENILHQLVTSSADTKLQIPLDDLEIRCFKGDVNIIPKKIAPHVKLQCTWQGEQQLTLDPLNGLIKFKEKKDEGIDLQKLTQHPVTIRLRLGGEHFRPDSKRPRRSLKKLLQEAAIPPWERSVLPLLFSGEQLVWVPGIGIDCNFQVAPGKFGLKPTWHPNAAINTDN